MSRYSQILFWPLLGRQQDSGIDVLKPDEHAVQPRARAFSMKAGMRWQSVSTCSSSLIRSLLLAQLDQAVEDRLPVPVAREVVVGDEEARDALPAFARTIVSTSSGVR
jgi:hypothetical protein